MTDERIHLHQAKGQVVLTEAHLSPNDDRKGLELITVMRWQDEDGIEGQDTVARLMNYLKLEQGALTITVGGEAVAVEVAPDGRTLRSRGFDPLEDPLLLLPTFDKLH